MSDHKVRLGFPQSLLVSSLADVYLLGRARQPVGAGYVVRTRRVNSLKRQQAYELALRAWVHTEQRLLTTARSYYPPFAQDPDDGGLKSPS